MKRINVLGICGSPRYPSNSAFLLEEALSAARDVDPERIETEFYSIKGKKFAPCYSCFDRCRELKGGCTVKDDFQELQGKWYLADAIIYSVPIYHMSYPAQLKCFVDRLGNTFGQAYKPPSKALKAIGAIAQGTHLFSGQEESLMDIIKHTMLMGCIPVAGDPWEAYLGAGGTTHSSIGKDAIRRLYAEEECDAVTAVTASRSVGRRVAEMALILRAGLLAEEDRFREDPKYRPFFDRLNGTLPENVSQAP